MNYKYFLILFTIILICGRIFAQSNEEIIDKLVDEGFENIKTSSIDSTLFICYENRVFRFEIDAVKNVIEIISDNIKDYKKIVLIVQNKKLPLTKITLNSDTIMRLKKKEISYAEFSDFMDISIDTMDEWEKINKANSINAVNNSTTKFDFVLKPTYKFQFGIYSDPVLYQLNFAPHIEFGFWKGSTFLYELTIPIHNDFVKSEDSVRTSMIVFNQSFRFSNSTFFSASLGYFTQNRYGIDMELRNYFSNGNISLGFNIGYTGYANFTSSKLFYSDPYLWTGAAYFDFRIPEYDLTLGASFGSYLMADYTFRVDINREFGEIQIGFFALRSSSGISNGGVNISIPLFPSKHWRPSFVRFRTIDNLSYSYLVKTDTEDLIGLRYNTGFRLIDFNQRMNPDFIKNYFKTRIK